MSNIRQFSSKEAIQEEACLWISRLDRGLRDDEKVSLDAWLAESQSHRSALLDSASLWDDMSVLNELSGLFPQYQTKREEPASPKRIESWWAVAATFLVVAIGAGFGAQHVWFSSPVELAYSQQNVSTGVGEQKNIVLSDGSSLHINTNSSVTIDFDENERHLVLLKGEAHFQVAHDSERPFVVTAGDNTVTAVGTAFNLQYLDDQAFELVVTEGKVLVKDRFSANNQRSSLFSSRPVAEEGLLMFAGEKATVQGDVDERENLSEGDINDDLAWQEGMIVFKGEPLQDALDEIGRYTSVRFTVIDDTLKNKRVAGFFKVGDIDGLLSTLESSFDVNHQRVGENRIHLSSQKNAS